MERITQRISIASDDYFKNTFDETTLNQVADRSDRVSSGSPRRQKPKTTDVNKRQRGSPKPAF